MANDLLLQIDYISKMSGKELSLREAALTDGTLMYFLQIMNGDKVIDEVFVGLNLVEVAYFLDGIIWALKHLV